MQTKGLFRRSIIAAALALSVASFAFPAVSETREVYAAEAATTGGTDIVKQADGGWYYTVNGKIDRSYTGFAKNKNGWWYIINGKVDFTVSGVIKGTVKGDSGWWYVSGGKVQFTDSIEQNRYGWWKIKNGKVDFNFTGLANRQRSDRLVVRKRRQGSVH